jgi:hypothetical protein
MNDISANISIGVIAGLLATLLTVGFRRVWISILVPWFEELVYKDAKIEGTWYGLSPDMDTERYDVISLKRNGHHVEARMTCSSSTDSGKAYCIIGSFRNLILSATYETEDFRGLDRGAMSLMLTENGNKLVGHLAYYSDPGHAINDATVIWYRDKKEFDSAFEEQQDEEDGEAKQAAIESFLQNANAHQKKKKDSKHGKKPEPASDTKSADVKIPVAEKSVTPPPPELPQNQVKETA